MGRGKKLRAGEIQSILILPFGNYTGADSLEYFVEGMHSSLISDMQRISEIQVKGKTTSNVFKNVDKKLHDIATEINVDAVIETDVMCLGTDSICLQHRLIRGSEEEEILWMGDYIEGKDQILNFYKRITKQIANELQIELTADEERYLAELRTIDRETYDAYLRSHQYIYDVSRESLFKAREYLETAIDKDPDWGPLYTAMTTVWMSIMQGGFEPPEIVGPKVMEYLGKALELDSNSDAIQFTVAAMAVWVEWNWEKGEETFKKCLELNPNNAMGRVFFGHLLMTLQRPYEALSQAQLAVELDPLNPFILALAAAVYHNAGDMPHALNLLDKALSIDPEHAFTINIVEPIAFQNGDYEKAFEAGKYSIMKIILRAEEDAISEIDRIYDEQGFFVAYETMVQLMEERTKTEYINPYELSVRYSLLGRYEKAMDWIEKGYELHDQNQPYVATGFYSDSLLTNPRFIAMMEKMNLPMPND
jgi:TolB-like protein